MQISRHWRLNAQRYRLEGFRNPNGQVSLQPRPAIQSGVPNPGETQIETAVVQIAPKIELEGNTIPITVTGGSVEQIEMGAHRERMG